MHAGFSSSNRREKDNICPFIQYFVSKCTFIWAYSNHLQAIVRKSLSKCYDHKWGMQVYLNRFLSIPSSLETGLCVLTLRVLDHLQSIIFNSRLFSEDEFTTCLSWNINMTTTKICMLLKIYFPDYPKKQLISSSIIFLHLNVIS